MAGHGNFSGEPVADWLTEAKTDRRMQLRETFWFKDPDEKTWTAPADYQVDGASIPRPLWALVGAPYVGNYRRASIVHDWACDEAEGDNKARRAADRMFYHACRAGGCSVFEAVLLYIGVRFGSLSLQTSVWGANVDEEFPGPRMTRTIEHERMESDFRSVAEAVLRQGETDSAEELEARTDRAIEVLTGIAI